MGATISSISYLTFHLTELLFPFLINSTLFPSSFFAVEKVAYHVVNGHVDVMG